MPIDYKNPTENDILWMEAMQNAQALVMTRPELPHFEGVMVFTRFLDEFSEPMSWDEGNQQLKSLIDDGPAREAFKARSIELAKEAVIWLRDVIDARYAKDAALGSPTDDETHDFMESHYGKQVTVFSKPDFFEAEVMPILNSFYEDRSKYSAAAFAMSAALGLPLSVAQQIVEDNLVGDGGSAHISDEGRDFSFES